LTKKKKTNMERTRIAAVSGGPDSMYLVERRLKGLPSLLLAHFNHGARGKESDDDQKFVETRSRCLGVSLSVGTGSPVSRTGRISRKGRGRDEAGFERKARQERYAFLRDLKRKYGAEKIVMGHTADDQVETILMRVMEGAGITGLKGIPRQTAEIERPLLDTWREEILGYLRKHKIPYRVDRTNRDIRYERNWVRHVLLPLLERRYGKAVKKRIFTLGERFREIDAYLEENARNWIAKGTVLQVPKGGEEKRGSAAVAREQVTFSRKAFAALPTVLRIKIVQILCFEWIGTEPNERLLASMDRLIVSGRPSARLNIGRGAVLRCRYGEAILSLPVPGESDGNKYPRSGQAEKRKRERSGREIDGKSRKMTGAGEPVVPMEGPGRYGWMAGGDPASVSPRSILWEEKGKTAPSRIRRLAEGELRAVFDGGVVARPLFIRSLRAGDRIRPFGRAGEKKAKEVLIDRKVPREERWGRPVVCDAKGEILWIPGVVRSAHAPVTPLTRRTIVLRAETAKGTSS
jgi:tRNA(Ile)-lysidine synthase